MDNPNLGYQYYRDLYSIEDYNLRVKPKVASSILKTKSISSYKIKTSDTLSFYTTYPGLATGTGISHGVKGDDADFKMGMIFDHTSGAPIIQGSSVKGILRSAFPNMRYDSISKNYSYKSKKDEVRLRWILAAMEGDRDEDIEPSGDLKQDKINEVGILYDAIFNGIEERGSGNYISIYKRDVFHHAVFNCTGNIFFAKDAITPHVKDGMDYEKAILKNPTPLRMLKITSNNEVIFQFDLKDHALLNKAAKLLLFKRILLHYGVGAKTNVGYGRLSLEPLSPNAPLDDPLESRKGNQRGFGNRGGSRGRTEPSSYDPPQPHLPGKQEETELEKRLKQKRKEEEAARERNETLKKQGQENIAKLAETGELNRPYTGKVTRVDGNTYFIGVEELGIELDRDIKKELKKGIRINKGIGLKITFTSFKKPIQFKVEKL